MGVEKTTVRLSVDVPSEMRYRLRRAALEARMTLREYVVGLLENQLEKRGEEKRTG